MAGYVDQLVSNFECLTEGRRLPALLMAHQHVTTWATLVAQDSSAGLLTCDELEQARVHVEHLLWQFFTVLDYAALLDRVEADL